MLTMAINPEELAALVEQIAVAVVVRLQTDCPGLANHGTQCPPEKLALSTDEAAEVLSISPRLLWDLQNSGKIRATRCGTRVVYAVAELKRFLEAE